MFYGLNLFLLLPLFCVSDTTRLMEQIFKFFSYLTTSYETITSSYPNVEVLYLRDLNVNHSESFGLPHGDIDDKEAKSLQILSYMKQLIKEIAYIPYYPNQFLDTLIFQYYSFSL